VRESETRFAFDLELFVAASTAGDTTAIAAPVELKERLAGSSVSKCTIVRTLQDALVVLARRNSTHHLPRLGPSAVAGLLQERRRRPVAGHPSGASPVVTRIQR
jgi:hypothetical protein